MAKTAGWWGSGASEGAAIYNQELISGNLTFRTTSSGATLPAMAARGTGEIGGAGNGSGSDGATGPPDREHPDIFMPE
jgi:hypothetical protein